MQVELLQTVDGIGPITAVAFLAEVDGLSRFKNSKDVAAYLGLTPTQYASGETIGWPSLYDHEKVF